MTAQSNKSLRDYTMKADISAEHERIIREMFNALFVSERQYSIKTDHTPSHHNIMTLDIYQIQQLIHSHSDRLITHMAIIDALYDLIEPRLLMPSTIIVVSEIDGKRIDAIRLDYSKPAKTDELAEELAQIDLGEALADEIDKCDAGRRWMEQQDTIQSLRSVIVDMAETLHVADPNACISMTSSDLLGLINSQNDMSDNAF
ncbi:hypothetical protein [Psychrobacter sp. HII-4]|uniref:hypothetical protein n=1 Tax=Psychrobacter sp. HII-4 TaxID=1569264 RepID=UPI00191B6977|nr:hypothetical protein [Psychrobacter sp. HII-4]